VCVFEFGLSYMYLPVDMIYSPISTMFLRE